MHTKTTCRSTCMELKIMCIFQCFCMIAYSILFVWIADVSQSYESSHMLLVLLQNPMISEIFI